MVQGIRCKPHHKEEPCLECRKDRQHKVIVFDGVSRLDLPAERILQAAIDAKIETAIIIGYDPDGEFYFASTKADGGDVIWLMEIAKKKLLEMTE